MTHDMLCEYFDCFDINQIVMLSYYTMDFCLLDMYACASTLSCINIFQNLLNFAQLYINRTNIVQLKDKLH